MLAHVFNQTGKIINTTTDKHGDQKVDSETEISLRFRYITELDKGVNREGVMTASDAIVWMAPDTAVEEGSILYIDSKYWRINRLIRARRMSGSTVEFLKAFVDAHNLSDE